MILNDDEKTVILTLAGAKCVDILKMDWGLKTKGTGWKGAAYTTLLQLVTIRLLKDAIEKTCCRTGLMDVVTMADELMKGAEEDDE